MSKTFDEQYAPSLRKILSEGRWSTGRTGTPDISLFDVNYFLEPNKTGHGQQELPMTTLRKVAPRLAYEELCWYLRGSTDVRELQERNIHVWDGNSSREFLDKRGLKGINEYFIGKAYGYQMRNFGGKVDQLLEVVNSLRLDPYGRRHLITFWNPADSNEMALLPCAHTYDFMVQDGYLHLKLIQRSGDMILGVPANIMIAAFFQTLMAHMTGLGVGFLAHSITNAHIYENLIEASNIMLEREQKMPTIYKLNVPIPQWRSPLVRKPITSEELNSFVSALSYSDVEILFTDSHPPIPRELLKMAI